MKELDRVREEDRGRSFADQPLIKRVIIVGAGPLMNLVFPIALFFVVANLLVDLTYAWLDPRIRLK